MFSLIDSLLFSKWPSSYGIRVVGSITFLLSIESKKAFSNFCENSLNFDNSSDWEEAKLKRPKSKNIKYLFRIDRPLTKSLNCNRNIVFIYKLWIFTKTNNRFTRNFWLKCYNCKTATTTNLSFRTKIWCENI